MSRDSRIAYIIGQLGELRELLLVIEQAGDTAPDILLKLAREKAESIDRSTRELRSPRFWAEVDNHDPFTDNPADSPSEEHPEAPARNAEPEPAPEPVESGECTAQPAYEEPEEAEELQDDPWNMPVNEPEPEAEPEPETVLDPEPVAAEAEPATPAEEPAPVEEEAEEEPRPENPDETPAEEPATDEEPLYPWEQMSDEELAAQNDKEDYDDETDYDEEADDSYDYGHPDYEDTPAADLPPDAPSAPVTLEEALQRQQAKELRKALSLNDRFRFRRELFGNSDIRMNETLALIDAMNSYDEAEDYILNDLNWDIENPEVAEFMKIVQKHFL